jgi:hypothetical protein
MTTLLEATNHRVYADHIAWLRCRAKYVLTQSGKFVEYQSTQHQASTGHSHISRFRSLLGPTYSCSEGKAVSLLASFDLRDSLRECRAASKGMICTASTNHPLLLLTRAQILHTFTTYSLPISPGHPAATCSDIGLACIFVKPRE